MNKEKLIGLLLVLVILGFGNWYIRERMGRKSITSISPAQPTSTSTASSGTSLTYKNTDLGKDWPLGPFGIEFSYPAHYELYEESAVPNGRNAYSEIHLIILRPEGWRPDKEVAYSVEYPIRITLYNDTFLGVAQREGFVKQGDQWVLLGVHGNPVKAEETTVNGFRVIDGTTLSQVPPKNDLQNVTNSDLSASAIISNGLSADKEVTAVITMAPLISKAVFRQILSSFKFIQ